MHRYAAAIAVVYGLGSFSVASWIHSRWFGRRPSSFYNVYAAVLTWCVASGWIAFGPPRLRCCLEGMLEVAGGAIAGLAAVQADRAIVRRFVRRDLLAGGAARAPAPGAGATTLDPAARAVVVSTAGSPRSLKVSTVMRMARMGRAGGADQPLLPLLAAAILEELVYRDILVRAAWLLPGGWLPVLAVAGTVVVFALAHLDFGWPHVWAKLPLGALCLALVLVTSSIIPAIAAHGLFNVKAWLDMRGARHRAVPGMVGV